jgi:type 1 fimbria pilin
MSRALIMQGLVLASVLVIPPGARAESVYMAFSGTLIEPPPCTINNGGRIEVPFGEQIGINSVDGVNHRQVINYQITCDKSSGSSWALTLTLSSDKVAVFDPQALGSNRDNLGIRVYQNNALFTPGSTMKVDLNNPPRLEAVLVKKSGTSLTQGTFEALATLKADYQ